MDVTVCCLFYGNHPDLAHRLVSSLIDPRFKDQFTHWRIGTNNISSAVNEIVADLPAVRYYGGSPYHKYPLMKEMFKDIMTPYVMWFDDDSYILPSAESNWFDQVENQFRLGADMIGKIYHMRRGLVGNQHLWIEDQPWYGGKPDEPGMKNPFITGGWWTIRTSIIQKWHWPSSDIKHNGGDMMLGELCRQQGYNMKNFDHGVGINAKMGSERSSSAPRRGSCTKLVGELYQRSEPNWQDTLATGKA